MNPKFNAVYCKHQYHVRAISLWPLERVRFLSELTQCGTGVVHTERLLNSEEMASWSQGKHAQHGVDKNLWICTTSGLWI